MRFKVYRDGDSRLRIRKVIIELYHGSQLMDRRRMFSRWSMKRFAKVLARKQKHMLRLAEVMLEAQKKES